jgi:hypothetical protein
MSEAHYYAVAIAATHTTADGATAIGVRAAVVKADSIEQAEQAALEAAIEAYPASDGWSEHYSCPPYRIDEAIIAIERPKVET